MNSALLWTSGAVAYFFLFFLSVVGVFRWQIHRRKERPPQEFKLLRRPGETLHRRTAEFMDDLLPQVIFAAGIPVALAGLAFQVVRFLPLTSGTLWFGATLSGSILIVGVVIAGLIVHRKMHRYRCDLLGYRGERAVAEYLEPLLADGHRIFHDVPAEGRAKDFNLDHVVVGPSGVTVVETKTRRKGRARPGFKDHEVTFDGQRLIWPWGEDSHGIEQAIAEADYLRKWVETRTGLKVPVKPILTLPGWYVHEKPGNGIRVVNSKILPDVIRGRGERLLTDGQIDLIARQLDLVCRDVED